MNIFATKVKASICLIGFLVLWLGAVSLHAQSASDSKPNNVPGKSWGQLSSVEKAQMICALSALPVFFVAEIWFIAAGFKTSVGWGLFMLFIGGMRSIFAALAMIGWMLQWVWLTHEGNPFQIPGLILAGFVVVAGTCAMVFVTRHWEQARRPLAVMAFGVVLILAVVVLQFAK